MTFPELDFATRVSVANGFAVLVTFPEQDCATRVSAVSRFALLVTFPEQDFASGVSVANKLIPKLRMAMMMMMVPDARFLITPYGKSKVT